MKKKNQCVTVHQIHITTLPTGIPELLICEKMLDGEKLFLSDSNIYDNNLPLYAPCIILNIYMNQQVTQNSCD